MPTVSRLFRNGDLFAYGEVDELLPRVTDGLVAHFPLDRADCVGMTFLERNLVNYRTWVIGSTGAQPGFSENADVAGENKIVLDYDPFGKKTAIWQAKPVSMGGSDGGWNVLPFPIDPTKTYRVSVWIRRTVIGAGNFYHGPAGYGNDQLLDLAGNPAGNPYFEYGTISSTEWRLYVGHVWASSKSDSNPHPNTGIFNRHEKLAGGTDYKWKPGATIGACRSYLFYCSDPSTTQQFCYPRFEVVDGLEPTISQLLSGEGYAIPVRSCIGVNTPEDGVALEGPVTNLTPWGDFSTLANFLTDEGTPTILPCQGVCGRNALKITKPADGTWGNWQARSSFPETVTAGTTYTMSVKYKAQAGANFALGDWGGPNGNQPAWKITADYAVQNGWRQRVCSITYNSDFRSGFICGINSTSPGKWLVFSDLQLERRSFRTAFVAGSHPRNALSLYASGFVGSTGTMSIDFFLESTSQYAIHVLDGRTDGGKAMLAYMEPATGALCVTDLSGTNTVKGLKAVTPLEWHTATITWDGDYMSLYLDGFPQGSVPAPGDPFKEISTLWPGYQEASKEQYARFKNLSVFSRALTAREVRTLARAEMAITKSGGISTRKLIEGKIVHEDWHYFPLGSDGCDITRQVAPTQAINLAFEDSACWVGTAVTNLNNNGSGLWGNNGGTIIDYGNSGPNGTKRWLFTKTGTARQWHGWETGLSGNFPKGSCFTASFYSKNETLGMGWSIAAYVTDWSRNLSNWAYGPYNQGPSWKKHVGTITFNETCSSFVTADGPSWNYSNQAGTCEFAGLMWETKPFASPFCQTSRGAGRLTYNLYSSIGLDWSGNWTLAYWKKPVGTPNDTFTHYNIDSIGSNPGQGGAPFYAWWGKQYSSDSIVGPQSTPASGGWGKYFGEWQLVVLRKSGSTIFMEIRGRDFVSKASSKLVPTTPSACVNPSWNYDLQLGGWDNTHPVNTFFRDLIVAKYAMTDAEVDMIYSQARLIKDGISVPCVFEEGLR